MKTKRLKWIRKLVLLIIICFFSGLMTAAQPVYSAVPNPTITVNHNGDLPDASGGDGVCATSTGKCTLRAAIETAEYQSGANLIEIGTSVLIIGVGSSTSQALPPLATGGTTIKGNGTYISGTSTPGGTVGFEISSNNNKIQGLVILNFHLHGVYIIGGADNVIGTDGDGLYDGDEGNQIVSNTADGVYIWGNNNQVSGNTIGTGGSSANPNRNGIYIYSGTGNLIGTNGDGTSDTEERNVISGNSSDGIEIRSGQNTVAGNYIGTDDSGGSAIPNGWYGVEITNSATYNVIGTNGDGQGDSVEGNIISGNTHAGVMITGAGTNRNKVAGNIIGLDITGSLSLPNGNSPGIEVKDGAANNFIGTDNDGQSDQAEGNVISGNNGEGVWIHGSGCSGNEVAGNYIGVNAVGNLAIGNEAGVKISSAASGNQIGGTGTWSGNLISGNDYQGILFYDGTENNTVMGNFIGTNKTGLTAIPNVKSGIKIQESENNEIGGVTEAKRNVISGNDTAGVWITGADSTGNIIQGNYIGVGSNGVAALGNASSGIVIGGAAYDNIIGGTSAGAGNTIANNSTDGVLIGGEEATGNTIRGNSIYTNGGIGIDLQEGYTEDGPTANDSDDSDIGPNEYQNFPVLTKAEINLQDGGLDIVGVLTSTNNSDFDVDFYLSRNCDPSGYGEGRAYLDSTTLYGGSSGVLAFVLSLPGSYNQGDFVTATATDEYGNTSEFSQCKLVSLACRGVYDVSIAGKTSGYPGDYTFTTAVIPTTATEPITYLWDNGDATTASTRNLDLGTHNLTVTISNCGGDHASDEHQIVISEAPSTCVVPLTGITISGPTSGDTGALYSFSTALQPSNATTPVTYSWTPEPQSGQGSSTAIYSWDTPGEETIAVNAQNCGGARTDSHVIDIAVGAGGGYHIYLPLVMR